MKASYEQEYAARMADLADEIAESKSRVDELSSRAFEAHSRNEYDALIGERETAVSRLISQRRQMKELSQHPDVNERMVDALERIATSLEQIHDDLKEIRYR